MTGPTCTCTCTYGYIHTYIFLGTGNQITHSYFKIGIFHVFRKPTTKHPVGKEKEKRKKKKIYFLFFSIFFYFFSIFFLALIFPPKEVIESGGGRGGGGGGGWTWAGRAKGRGSPPQKIPSSINGKGTKKTEKKKKKSLSRVRLVLCLSPHHEIKYWW